MEKYILILSIFLIFSCADSKQSLVEKYSFEEISDDLGDIYSDIVKDLKVRHAVGIESKSEDRISSNPIRNFMSKIDEYKLSSLSYYKFDIGKFYEDPSIENLQKCMFPMDKMNIIAERDGEIEWRAVIYKREGTWAFERLTPQYGKIVSWLCDSLYNAGTQKCKIFLQGSTREFVTYEKGGESLYFKITGDPIPAGRLCEYFVAEYKRGLENQKYIEEHPELFAAPFPEQK